MSSADKPSLLSTLAPGSGHLTLLYTPQFPSLAEMVQWRLQVLLSQQKEVAAAAGAGGLVDTSLVDESMLGADPIVGLEGDLAGGGGADTTADDCSGGTVNKKKGPKGQPREFNNQSNVRGAFKAGADGAVPSLNSIRVAALARYHSMVVFVPAAYCGEGGGSVENREEKEQASSALSLVAAKSVDWSGDFVSICREYFSTVDTTSPAEDGSVNRSTRGKRDRNIDSRTPVQPSSAAQNLFFCPSTASGLMVTVLELQCNYQEPQQQQQQQQVEATSVVPSTSSPAEAVAGGTPNLLSPTSAGAASELPIPPPSGAQAASRVDNSGLASESRPYELCSVVPLTLRSQYRTFRPLLEHFNRYNASDSASPSSSAAGGGRISLLSTTQQDSAIKVFSPTSTDATPTGSWCPFVAHPSSAMVLSCRRLAQPGVKGLELLVESHGDGHEDQQVEEDVVLIELMLRKDTAATTTEIKKPVSLLRLPNFRVSTSAYLESSAAQDSSVTCDWSHLVFDFNAATFRIQGQTHKKYNIRGYRFVAA